MLVALPSPDRVNGAAAPHRGVIVVDAGSYPLDDKSLSGVGLRLVEIARSLSSLYRVHVVSSTRGAVVSLGDADHYGADEADAVIAAADVVMFFDTPDRHRIESAVLSGALIVSECRAPLEQMSYPSVLERPDPIGEHQRYLGPYRRLLEVSNHFLCRSEPERIAIIATLCTTGRITPEDMTRSATLDHLVTVVPVGFGRLGMEAADHVPPAHMADFLWTGGVWNFFNPLLFVEAMAILRDRGSSATGAFLHAVPSPDTLPAITAIERSIARLGLAETIHLNGSPMTQAEREGRVKSARAYVCIARPSIENQTGTRLRLRDSWLHGVPTVIDPWGISAGLVERERLGVVLTDPTPASLADALASVMAGEVQGSGRHLDHLYESTLEPLCRWIDTTLAGFGRVRPRADHERNGAPQDAL